MSAKITSFSLLVNWPTIKLTGCTATTCEKKENLAFPSSVLGKYVTAVPRNQLTKVTNKIPTAKALLLLNETFILQNNMTFSGSGEWRKHFAIKHS
jgi:hypothetical protein